MKSWVHASFGLALRIVVSCVAIFASVAVEGLEIVGSEMQLNQTTGGDQELYALVRTQQGDFVGIWKDIQTSRVNVVGRKLSSDGSPVTGEWLVNQQPLPTSHFDWDRVSATVLSDGNIAVVWGTYDDGDQGVSGRIVTPDGAPLTPEFRVNDIQDYTQEEPDVASAMDGSFVVVWQGRDPNLDHMIYMRRFSDSGSPMGPSSLVNEGSGVARMTPRIAAVSGGPYMVVWDRQNPGPAESQFSAMGRLFDSQGAPMAPEFQVANEDDGGNRFPRAFSNSLTRILVTWFGDFPQYGYGPIFKIYDPTGQVVVDEEPIYTNPFFSNHAARGAMGLNNQFVLVWDRKRLHDPNDYDVAVRVFSADGIALGDPFRANATLANIQSGPMIALNADGNGIIAWTSRDQDGSGTGIFYRTCQGPVDVTLQSLTIE